jgi:hypothetical protein
MQLTASSVLLAAPLIYPSQRILNDFIEDQTFLRSWDSAPRPPHSTLSCQKLVSLSQSSCVSPVERRERGGGVRRGAKTYDVKRSRPPLSHSVSDPADSLLPNCLLLLSLLDPSTRAWTSAALASARQPPQTVDQNHNFEYILRRCKKTYIYILNIYKRSRVLHIPFLFY